jgi:formimidoylglutamase
VKPELPHLVPPGVVVNALKGDPEEHRAHRWLEWDGGELECAVLGVPFDGGSVVRTGSRHGPDAVRSAMRNYTDYSTHSGRLASDIRAADIGDVAVSLTDMKQTFGQITDLVGRLAGDGVATVCIGGDHSITWPIVEGVSCGRRLRGRAGERLGVIHFDQHHDLREAHFGSESSGVPFRKILELPGNPVQGRNLVQVGIGDMVNAPLHRNYATERGVTVITNIDVHREGLDRCVDRALGIAGDGVDALYVSVDIDCIDQSQAPGTAAPNANGLDARDLYRAVRLLAQDHRTVGIDVVEIAPQLEPGDLTANVGAMIVLSFLIGMAERRTSDTAPAPMTHR